MAKSEGSVHLVGSVPLASVPEVLKCCADRLGPTVTRLTDGEAGGWVNIPSSSLIKADGIEDDPDHKSIYKQVSYPRYRLKKGVDPATIRFAPTTYVDIAKSSYAIFKQAQAAGDIPSNVRFQQCMPTPHAALSMAMTVEDTLKLLPYFSQHVFKEVAQICKAIPHEDLAFQWDVAVEVVEVLANYRPDMAERLSRDDVATNLARALDAVPADVPCGMHLCYGCVDNKPVVQFPDLSEMVKLANNVVAKAHRPLSWLHVPGPDGPYDEDRFFAPLADLKLSPQTEFYLGVVNMDEAGTLRRTLVAKRVMRSFGVGTECGMRYFKPEEIGPLLTIHRKAAAAAAT
jgi:hypothetical protein